MKKLMICLAALWASGCAMTVDNHNIATSEAGDFILERRTVRDASSMWDDTYDSGEVWAINRSPVTYCVSGRSGDSGYTSRYSVPPGTTQKLMNVSYRSGYSYTWSVEPCEG